MRRKERNHLGLHEHEKYISLGTKKKPEAHLLKSLVVDKAGSILGDLELALLYLLAEFPVQKETSGAIRDTIQMT